MLNSTERKRGRNARLNFAQRLEIIEKFQQDKPSKRSLALQYNVDEKSIRNILLNSEKIKEIVNHMDTETRETTYKLIVPKFPKLEYSLAKWIDLAKTYNQELSSKIIIDRAKKIAADLGISHESFKASKGWYDRFITRQNFSYMLAEEEVAEVEVNGQESPSELDCFFSIIKQHNPEDVYLMSEMGLFYCLLPQYTAFFPDEDISTVRAKKRLYSRMTLAVCCNSTGSDRVPITMVSKSKAPACIHGNQWPIPNLQQDHALIDKDVFVKWFEEVFRKHVQQKVGRRILLILDNVPMYQNDFDTEGIQILFFPKNGPLLKKPMELGIFKAFKISYKLRLMKDIIFYHNSPLEIKEQQKVICSKMKRGSAGIQFGKPAHLLDAANLCGSVWNDLSPEIIRESFQNANFFSQSEDINPVYNKQNQEAEKNFELMHEFYEMFQYCYLPFPEYLDKSAVLEDIKEFLCLDDHESKFYQQCVKEDIEQSLDCLKHS